jgi:ribonuclease P/MRP protein subunit RPP25
MSLEKYKLVSDTKADFDNLNVAALWTTRASWQKTYHELRITQKGKPKNYIADALQFFKQGSKKVMLRALGRAINKAITITEVLKRKIALHQRTHLSSFKVVDVSNKYTNMKFIYKMIHHLALF